MTSARHHVVVYYYFKFIYFCNLFKRDEYNMFVIIKNLLLNVEEKIRQPQSVLTLARPSQGDW